MKKPPKSIMALAGGAGPEPTWTEVGGVLHATFRDEERSITVVMRARDEWRGKDASELRRLTAVSRRTLGAVWLLDGDGWRKL